MSSNVSLADATACSVAISTRFSIEKKFVHYWSAYSILVAVLISRIFYNENTSGSN